MSIKQSLTTKQLLVLFGVSAMSIHSWSKGTATRDALPSVKNENGTRSFSLVKVKQWAKRYGITMLVDPETLLGETLAKPGPKPKAAEKKPRNPAMAHAGRLINEAAARKKPRQVAARLKKPAKKKAKPASHVAA